jgi:hypothetical protein
MLNAECRMANAELRMLSAPGEFVLGANLPWIGYGTDFGANAWSPGGDLAADPVRLSRLDDTLARLAADGLGIARVFLLCDLRSGVHFDTNRLPVALDDELFADIDALVAAARRHGVSILPVLLDFHLCNPEQWIDGVQLGGRAHLVATGEGRRALIESVIAPIVRRYGADESIVAWDVMNEPEWCLRLASSRRLRDPFGPLQDLLAGAVRCVRAHARQPVTVGCAGTWQLDLVRSLGLDFYQVHWYERFGWSALAQPVTNFALDRPVLLGEFSGRTARISRVLETARRAGYCGALVWSVLAEDDQSGYPAEFVRWSAQQPRP